MTNQPKTILLTGDASAEAPPHHHDAAGSQTADPSNVIALADNGIPQSIEAFLQAQLQRYFAAHAGGLPAPGLYQRLLVRLEKPLIMQTLRATGGNQIKAADILGLNRNTLRKKMRELGITTRQLLIRDAA